MMMLVTGKTKGLTFIEILFVIIIIGILMGISLPRFRNTFNSLQLVSFSGELQTFMNYLQQRAVIESRVIYLDIDNGNRQYRACSGEKEKNILKAYQLPDEIKIETDKEKINFYPDGSIDKVTLKIINRDSQYVELTTRGVFGGVKVQSQ
jgi:prepilin-type N-terminal cleavage/methylation domain-containing protein